jgi:phosphonoacetaldehyde hydrolase
MTHRAAYTGKLKAIIFDWAGTTVDYGCFAPVSVFVTVFKNKGIDITIPQARAPMGLEKKDHIRAITQQPEVAAQWQTIHGRAPNEADIESMYQDTLDKQLISVREHANLIPGTLETVHYCRASGLKIGTSTGYNRNIMNTLLTIAVQQGYTPDAVLCPSDVPAGRPAPWMIYQNAMQLGVYPMAALIKVGDTVPDIAEGLNAGVWTIGITQTGNELGLTQSEVEHLTEAERDAKLAPIEKRLLEAGAHYVVRSIADVPAILASIEARLQVGEQP